LYFNSTKSGNSKYYYTELIDFNVFSKPEIVKGEINSDRNNNSYITFESEDIAYISSFRQFPERSYLNIFQTRRKRDKWLKPFDTDSLIYSVFMAHPTVSRDGTFMIFSTKLYSEFGDTDLWIAYKQDNGTWGNLNRISSLQSPGNEITPYLSGNDTLYFASDGQEGPGGYDIFMSVKDRGIWQMPYPLEEINTEFNESDFVVLPNNKAIFASDRPGGSGGLDLYLSYLIKNDKKNNWEIKPDFSIATQVPVIKVKSEVERQLNPLFTYYFFDIENFKNIQFSSLREAESNDPVVIHNFSPYVISENIKKFPKAKLYVNIFVDSLDEGMKKELIIHLTKVLNLENDRLNISFYSIPEDFRDYAKQRTGIIKFESNDERVFQTVYIGKEKTEIIPPALEMTIDARPRGLISDWICNFKIGVFAPDSVVSGKEMPCNFIKNLKKYGDMLNKSDSLVVIINVKDSLGNSYHYNHVFNIVHMNNIKEKLIKEKGNLYSESFLLVTNKRDLHNGNSYLNTFRVIAEIAQANKTVIIQYYDRTSHEIAKEIQLLIREQTNGPHIKTELELIPKDDRIDKTVFSRFLFRVLIKEN